MSGDALLIGGTDQACMLAWQQALGRQMQAVTSSRPEGEKEGDAPDLLKLELTGIHALGILGKAREAATGVAKDMLEKGQLTEGYTAIATAMRFANERGVSALPLLRAIHAVVWESAGVGPTLGALTFR
jgi:hypothetical protein